MYRKLVGPSGMTTTATIAAAAIPFVFPAKSRKALLPFRSRISSAYCGSDPFFSTSLLARQILGGDYIVINWFGVAGRVRGEGEAVKRI